MNLETDIDGVKTLSKMKVHEFILYMFFLVRKAAKMKIDELEICIKYGNIKIKYMLKGICVTISTT